MWRMKKNSAGTRKHLCMYANGRLLEQAAHGPLNIFHSLPLLRTWKRKRKRGSEVRTRKGEKSIQMRVQMSKERYGDCPGSRATKRDAGGPGHEMRRDRCFLSKIFSGRESAVLEKLVGAWWFHCLVFAPAFFPAPSRKSPPCDATRHPVEWMDSYFTGKYTKIAVVERPNAFRFLRGAEKLGVRTFSHRRTR